jgi:toxin ParE1/3/4
LSPKLRVRPEAEAELTAAINWYEAKRRGVGIALLSAVDHALDRIVELPGASPLWKVGYPYRKHILKRFPFLIIFTLLEGRGIEVIAIAHTKRNPGYWLNRIETR